MLTNVEIQKEADHNGKTTTTSTPKRMLLKIAPFPTFSSFYYKLELLNVSNKREEKPIFHPFRLIVIYSFCQILNLPICRRH